MASPAIAYLEARCPVSANVQLRTHYIPVCERARWKAEAIGVLTSCRCRRISKARRTDLRQVMPLMKAPICLAFFGLLNASEAHANSHFVVELVEQWKMNQETNLKYYAV